MQDCRVDWQVLRKAIRTKSSAAVLKISKSSTDADASVELLTLVGLGKCGMQRLRLCRGNADCFVVQQAADSLQIGQAGFMQQGARFGHKLGMMLKVARR